MNENKKTITIGGVALCLALLALIMSPRTVTPDAFFDQGEVFFPEFTDPNEATSLEVVSYNEEIGSPILFKVMFTKGTWKIPSHYDYPADGKDRLAKTAAGVIGIKKDDYRTDNLADHKACGVIGPLDDSATSLTGRGQRVTIKNANDKILADIIVGNTIENRPGFRFVRLPDQKRVYAVRIDIDISTNFSDWIESDLMQVQQNKINKVVLQDYSINERTLQIIQKDIVTLTKDGNNWSANKMRSAEEIDRTKMNSFLGALDNLSIVGIRPKPAGLSSALSNVNANMRISQNDAKSLQSKGYFFTGDRSLRSNEGEIQVLTDDGIYYTLRFGEIVYGTGAAVSAGSGGEELTEGTGENRYLFISSSFVEDQFPEPPKPADVSFESKPDSLWSNSDRENKDLKEEHDTWVEKIENGTALSLELNQRFAQWYYVISSDIFDKLDLSRNNFIKEKEKTSSDI
jgi:hypothetical protein